MRGLVAGIRHQCHIPCEFDGLGYYPLVGTAEFVSSGRANLELGCDKLAQKSRVLVVDFIYIVLTENALHAMLC